MSVSVVKFLTRTGCHLCDEARPWLESAAKRYRFEIEEVDIDGDDDLIRDYGLRIPVVMTPEGTVIAEGEIKPRQVRRALHKLR